MMVHFTFLRGVEVDKDTRRYVERKLETAGKPLKGLVKTEVEIEQDKRDRYFVSVIVRSAKEVFRAGDSADTVEIAIDTIEKELQEQIRDAKEKKIDLARRGARSIKKKKVVADDARE